MGLESIYSTRTARVAPNETEINNATNKTIKNTTNICSRWTVGVPTYSSNKPYTTISHAGYLDFDLIFRYKNVGLVSAINFNDFFVRLML